MGGRVMKPIGDGYTYGYHTAGIGKARWRRMTLAERIRLWRRRKFADDLAGLRGWIA